MSDYNPIPSTEQVREAATRDGWYTFDDGSDYGDSRRLTKEEWQKWLDAHDAEVRAEAEGLHEAYIDDLRDSQLADETELRDELAEVRAENESLRADLSKLKDEIVRLFGYL